MANWYGSARSNYFRVKDRDAFIKWVQTLPEVKFVEKDRAFALLSREEYRGWPLFRPCEELDHDEQFKELDWVAELAKHLAEGEVCVLQEIGAEKLRYLTGEAVAINSAGATLRVSIDDIYELVHERWNIEPSPAEY
jgi:hypothetical protein